MLTEKVRSAAELADCGEELDALQTVTAYLQGSPVKNVVVLGETNSGKTRLINRLAGTEVRRPSALSLGERPLKVVFDPQEEDPDYETVCVRNPELAAMKLALYEIPLGMAIDRESGQVRPILQKMDAVIYVLSAVTPFTADDADNLETFADAFPLILYISKSDMIADGAEREEMLDYMKKEFGSRFESSCEMIDGREESAAARILKLIGDMELDGLREYRVSLLEGQFTERIAEKLGRKLAALEEEKEAHARQAAAAREVRRQERLDWDKIRLEMMEKEQQVLELSDKTADEEKAAAAESLIREMESASGKKAWLRENFRASMKQKLDAAARRVIGESKDLIDLHTSWLVSEVNRRFAQRIEAGDMKYSAAQVDGGNEECGETCNFSKFLLAAGAGIVAGGTIVSSIPLVPTCIVAIPASLLTAVFLKGGLDDYQKYDQKVRAFISGCCEKNFETLKKQLRGSIQDHYERLIGEVKRRSEAEVYETDSGDIIEQERQLRDALSGLR